MTYGSDKRLFMFTPISKFIIVLYAHGLRERNVPNIVFQRHQCWSPVGARALGAGKMAIHTQGLALVVFICTLQIDN